MAQAIDREFGNFEAMKTKLNTQTAAVQGSGWGWLVFNPATCRLQIVTLANQDPVSTLGMVIYIHIYGQYMYLILYIHHLTCIVGPSSWN